MTTCLAIFLIFFLPAHIKGMIPDIDCLSSVKGQDYIGTHALTNDGNPCWEWTTVEKELYAGTNPSIWVFPGDSHAHAHNFCRNPDASNGKL